MLYAHTREVFCNIIINNYDFRNPCRTHTSVPYLISVATCHCALTFNFPDSELMATPVSADTETSPVPDLKISIFVPTGNGTEELVGTVITIEEDDDASIILPESVKDNVYEDVLLLKSTSVMVVKCESIAMARSSMSPETLTGSEGNGYGKE